jgi:hypothetical protein
MGMKYKATRSTAVDDGEMYKAKRSAIVIYETHVQNFDCAGSKLNRLMYSKNIMAGKTFIVTRIIAPEDSIPSVI